MNAQCKYAQAQPLYEKALEINCRLFGDDHPDTATSYNNVAYNLNAQSRQAEAEPLFRKALAITRRLLSDNHPDTAGSYNSLAGNLDDQGKHAQAQELYQKAAEICQRRLTDDHPFTANCYDNLAHNLAVQGKYVQAGALYAKAFEIRRKMLGDDHPLTAVSYNNIASNLNAQGQYEEAEAQWRHSVRSQDAARLRIAFGGLERAVGARKSPRTGLTAVQARLGRATDAWKSLEEDLGRGLLDEMAARYDRRQSQAERARLGELTARLERLDNLLETTPKQLDRVERAKQFEKLNHERDLAGIALLEFQAKLIHDHSVLAGQVAALGEIQAVMPADAALVAWVDVPPLGPSAADPDGEHWGVVVRANGAPFWARLAGMGERNRWTEEDNRLSGLLREAFRHRPGTSTAGDRALIERARAQRLAPLAVAFSATADGLPAAHRLIVLPSAAMAGVPIEAILADDDTRTVSYAPSATVYKYLREQPRPNRHAGLLTLGDPEYGGPHKSSEPEPLPDHGLLLNVVVRGSNAAIHGLKGGDVLLAYNGTPLHKREDLKAVPERGQPVPVEVWRAGQVTKREVGPGKLGVVIDTRPAAVAIAEQRKLQQVLLVARSGGGDFAALPGTRYEALALAKLFQSEDRPTRALLGADASEPELDRLAASGELGRFGFIHLATHAVIDEAIPQRSAVILTQTGLPDPLEQVLHQMPVFDGRLSVREIQRRWDLKAELVTLSACETALGRDAGGEGFVGFTQALLMSGARSVCLSLWRVDDKATSLLMARFYQNLLGKRPGLAKPMPKAEALQEAKQWLRSVTADQIDSELAAQERGRVRPLARGKGAQRERKRRQLSQVRCGRMTTPTSGRRSCWWVIPIERFDGGISCLPNAWRRCLGCSFWPSRFLCLVKGLPLNRLPANPPRRDYAS